MKVIHKNKIRKFLKENQGKYTLEEVAKKFNVEVKDVVIIAKSLWGLKKEKEEMKTEYIEIYMEEKYKLLSEIQNQIKEKFGYVNFLRNIDLA